MKSVAWVALASPILTHLFPVPHGERGPTHVRFRRVVSLIAIASLLPATRFLVVGHKHRLVACVVTKITKNSDMGLNATGLINYDGQHSHLMISQPAIEER